MMSKASFMMQDQLRRNFSLITDIFPPSTFIVRGRLPFPQGLAAISILFRHKYPADVYAHPYFVEKQSDPNQPSPQLHITEESQGIMKVIGGLRYMRDDNSKLDNTMFVVTDYQVSAEGRMLSLDGIRPTSPATEATEHETQEAAQAAQPSGFPATSTRERARRSAEAAMGSYAGGGSFGDSPGGRQGTDVASVSQERHTGSLLGRTTFPTPEDSSSGRQVNADFFQQAVEAARSSASSAPGLAGSQHGESATATFPKREGGYTVLYNPIETNEKSFVNLIRKLEKEERVVAAIVVPTRQAWRHVQLWADAFPDAAIVSSGPIPIASAPEDTAATGDGGSVASAAGRQTTGGLQDFGNGVTGLSFPEVDLEAIAAEEARYRAELAANGGQKKSTHASRGKSGGTPGGAGRGGARAREASFEDPVDVLWDDAAQLLDPSAHTFVGLRAEDAHRVRVLRDEATQAEAERPASSAVPFHHVVRLTPRIELHHVEGDAVADEYVLYDVPSGTLACTDLYHGAYADLDPVNSWMCRVWFKFMKRGSHKRTDLVPRYKWLQVCRQGTLPQMQETVHRLTTSRPIWSLIYAHGTPPQLTDAASALRVQWGLPPLTEAQLEKIFSGARYRRSTESPAASSHSGETADVAPPRTPPRFAVGDQLEGAQIKD